MHRAIFSIAVARIWLLAPNISSAQVNPAGIPEDAIEATMVSVVDGDTIEVSINGTIETVRLIGIDSPERGARFADEAAAEMKRLIKPGRTIWLEQDISVRERFERLLAYVRLVRGS